MVSSLRLLGPALALAVLAGCAQQPVSRAPYPSQPSGGGWGYGSPQPQQPYGVQLGQVMRIERVDGGTASAGGVGPGAVVGGVVGAAVGRQIGRHHDSRTAGTVLGALGGAVIGHQIERGRQPQGGVTRVTVRFDSGSVQSFDYAELGDLRVGDRVRLQDGQLYRY